MVLDNMDDGQELGPQMGFVPIARIGPGSIIVTTRDMRVTQYLPDWDHINEDVIAIPSLEIGDARSLVEASLGPGQIANTNDLQDLLEMLGCFPLALTQAVAFIKHNRTTIAKYKSLLDQDNVLGHALLRDVEYRDIRRYDGIPNSILRIRTWEISFDKIQQQDPLAVDILARISIFDAPKGVPESLLYPKDYNEREFTAALGTLLSFSMVAMCPDGSIMMHALVQQAVRWVITSQGTREGFLLEASNRVAVPFTRESMTSWQHLVQLVAHVEEVLCYGSTIGHLGEETLLSRATLLHELASHKGFCCQYDSALVHAQEAYAIRRRALGGTERDTIRSLELVTFILAAQRQYKAAELNQQGVIKARQSVASSEDLATLESQWVLVTILRSSGQLTKALELCNTLKLADETGNILSARAISGLYFLGNELHAVGRIIEAERLYRRVLAESEGKSQVDGDVIKKARIGLNTLLRLSRDDSSACEINFNKIRARSETFGDKHPETIRSLCALGRIYFEQSNWKAAEDAMEQGYRTYMEVLGETHPDTMDSLSELAIIKARQGEFTEAEKLYRRILHQQSTVLGAHHPSTLISKNDLGKVLIELKKYEEARELLKQVIRLECRAWGRSSPVSLDAMQGLVQVQWNLGEFDDAERLCLELIKLVNEDLPTDNITLAGYMEQLAIVLEAQGRYSEAESQWREVVRLNANRDTRLAVTGRMGLGLLAHKQRRLDEAADFYREALAAGQNTEIDQQTMGTLSKFLERALAQQKEEQAAAQEL
jgi:tetratricopeptide (TPR) repeat protein